MHIHSEADLDTLLRGSKLLAVASAWSELGLWDRLAELDRPTELAELEGDLRALEITAPILLHAGLLDGDGRRYRLSALGADLHARGALPTARNLEFLDDLSRMTPVLRGGGPLLGRDGESKATTGGTRVQDRSRTAAFLEMLYRRSEDVARQVVDWLAPRLPEGGRILDVGGGHGRYAETFASRGFSATLFDLPLVIEIARERHGEALELLAGDFHRDALEGGPYHLALLSNIVHGESAEANAELLARVGRALAPGGLVVIKDMFIDEQGSDPENAVFFGATMLYYTQEGRSYTVRDVATWCAGAGLGVPEAITLGTSTLLVAAKRS